MDYEQKLGLVEKFQSQKKSVRKMLDLLESLETEGLFEHRIRQMETIKQIAAEILA